MTVHVPTVTLNNGVQMPILGFGVFQIPAEQTEQAVTDALAAGYRHLDTAASYGNEEAVGRAIAASGIPREELFVTTKLWVQDAGEEPTKQAFDASLRRLGLDYLDLYLIHQPYGDYYGSWRAMRALTEQGLARAVGVSNFYPDRLVDLIDRTGFTPAVNQIETHPYFQRQADQDLMVERGVQHESWGGFAEGRNNLFTDPTLTEIGAAHGKSVAQVVLRWLTQRGIVAIPKSVQPARMAQNLDHLRLHPHRAGDGPDRRAGHRHQPVLRPPRPRHGQPHRQPTHPRLTRLTARRITTAGTIHPHTRRNHDAHPHTRTGPGGLGDRPGRDGHVHELRPEPGHPRGHDRRAARRGGPRRHVLRHRRGVRPVRQRGARRRGPRSRCATRS